MREIKKLQARGIYDQDKEDPFDLFISSTNIRWAYYRETHKILGNTYGMCVLQVRHTVMLYVLQERHMLRRPQYASVVQSSRVETSSRRFLS